MKNPETPAPARHHGPLTAHNLQPAFFYLLDVTDARPHVAGQLFGFSLSYTIPGTHPPHSFSSSCETLLAVLLSFGQYQMPLTTPVQVVRSAIRNGSLARANNLTIMDAETLTLPEVFGTAAAAQALVAEVWERIHLGQEEPELSAPLFDIYAVQTADYEQNLRRTGDRDPCLVCGRPLTINAGVHTVHLSTEGGLLATLDEHHPDSQGFFFVGPDCAGKIPRPFLL